MKKSFLIGAMMCWMALNAQAQYQYDRALPLPTVDLYDTGVMNMYMRALAETSARRQQSYEQYSELMLSIMSSGEVLLITSTEHSTQSSIAEICSTFAAMLSKNWEI